MVVIAWPERVDELERALVHEAAVLIGRGGGHRGVGHLPDVRPGRDADAGDGASGIGGDRRVVIDRGAARGGGGAGVGARAGDAVAAAQQAGARPAASGVVWATQLLGRSMKEL